MKSNTYNVEANLSDMNCIGLIEPDINHEASEYIVENLATITRQARKMVGVDPNKVEDLVQDLIESILRSESRGEGYRIDHNEDGKVISVAEFVYGRLKGYSRNTKYQIGSGERHAVTRNTNGKSTQVVDFEVISASSANENDYDSMSAIQKAYATAYSYYNSIDDIDASVSLQQDIEFCIDFNEVVGFDFRNLFKNIDLFGSMDFDGAMFDRLRSAMNFHTELKEALHNVLTACANDRSAFDAVVATL